MTIYNDTDRVITVYNDSFEESIGYGKSITVEEEWFAQEKVFNVRYMALKEMKTGVESGWDRSTFGKKWFYYWYIHWEFPIECRIHVQSAEEIHITHSVEDIPTLLFPHMTVKKLNCEAEQGVAAEHFFSAAKDRRRFLSLQWVKSCIWAIVSILWLIAVMNALPAMNGITEVLLNGIWYLLLAVIPICFLVSNIKYLFLGMKWRKPDRSFPEK